MSGLGPPSSPLPATPGRFEFRHFQARLLAIILSLVVALQALVFFTVGAAANQSAIQASESALQLTLASLQNTIKTRENNLRKYARLLSHDFAFKALFSESDHDTLLSAFGSYQRRLNADWMFVLDLDGSVIADTLMTKDAGGPFAHPGLLQAAQQSPRQEASSALVMNGKTYQVRSRFRWRSV